MNKTVVVCLLCMFFVSAMLRASAAKQTQPADLKALSPDVSHQLFPAEAREIFEKSNRFEVLAIASETSFVPAHGQRFTDARYYIRNYAILKRTVIKDEKQKAAFIASLYDGVQRGEGSFACFSPHHAIRAKRGKKTVEMIICFHCSEIDTYYGKAKGFWMIAPAPVSSFEDTLKTAEVIRSE